MKHLFWFIFFAVVLIWYIVVTIIVSWKGLGNIRSMLEEQDD